MAVTGIVGDSVSANSFTNVDYDWRTGTSSNSWSVPLVSLGATDPARLLLVTFGWRKVSTGDSTTDVAVTLDGNPLTEIGYEANGRVFEGSLGLWVGYIEQPLGTTGTLAFSVSNFSSTARDMGFAIYRVINADVSSFSFAGNSGAGIEDITMNVPASGYGVLAAISDNDGDVDNFTGTNTTTLFANVAGAHGYRTVSGSQSHNCNLADGIIRMTGEYL